LPAKTFTILVFCDTCDRSAQLDRSKVLNGMTNQPIIKAHEVGRLRRTMEIFYGILR
jgi:hypothetical protein